MAVRITRVYTKTGDDGETGLVGGARVPKDDQRIEAFGCVDELNSAIGVALGALPPTPAELTPLREALAAAQQKLFDLGAHLATPPEARGTGALGVGARDVEALERLMDDWGKRLPPLESFVLPGGAPVAAWLHLARAVCRRAERETLRLHRSSPLSRDALVYLNRLSDFLFVAARLSNALLGHAETLWTPAAPAQET